MNHEIKLYGYGKKIACRTPYKNDVNLYINGIKLYINGVKK